METISKSIIKQVNNLLSKQSKIVITTHNNPDGDAIGSALGLFHCLKNQGYIVDVITPNDYPEFLQWLPGNESVYRFNQDQNQAAVLCAKADVIFTLDFNKRDRLAGFESFVIDSEAKKIMIDHHPGPDTFPDITISDVSVSSTAEKVYQFIDAMKWEEFVNKSVAECLFTGIMTDTGAFNFNSSSTETYRIVSRLLEQKIDKDLIFDKVYNNFSADRMRLLGYCLEKKMKVFPEFHAAFIWITLEELDQFNFEPGDTEGFVNYPLSIKGIRFTALFIEKEDHVKASFRSKGAFKVNEFSAKHFNGGGHDNAAGGEFRGSMEENNILFEKLLINYKEDLKNGYEF